MPKINNSPGNRSKGFLAFLGFGPPAAQPALTRRTIDLRWSRTGSEELASPTRRRERTSSRRPVSAHPDHHRVGGHLVPHHYAVAIIQRNLLSDGGRSTRELGVQRVLVLQATHQPTAGA